MTSAVPLPGWMCSAKVVCSKEAVCSTEAVCNRRNSVFHRISVLHTKKQWLNNLQKLLCLVLHPERQSSDLAALSRNTASPTRSLSLTHSVFLLPREKLFTLNFEMGNLTFSWGSLSKGRYTGQPDYHRRSWDSSEFQFAD